MHFEPGAFLTLPVVVLSLMAHECAHGWMALLHGDPTARDRGRLGWNPFPHLDPLGSIVLPLTLGFMGSPFLFGWARPIPIDHSRLRRPQRDAVRVALAGPAANLLLAIGFAATARATPQVGEWAVLRQIAVTGVAWNCGLAVFNLIPIPPLDGSWVLKHFLRMRHIIALHHFRSVALALTIATVVLPPSRWAYEASLRGVVGACFSLFGLTPNGMPH